MPPDKNDDSVVRADNTLKVGDTVRDKTGKYWWEVEAICLGAIGQESLVQLRSITQYPGVDTEGKAYFSTWVPEPLVVNLQRYRKVL